MDQVIATVDTACLVIDDICVALKPLKKGCGNPRPFVEGTIALAKLLALIPPTTAKAAKKRERKFNRAIAALGDDCPPDVALRLQTYAKQRISGRQNPLDKFCAFQAVEMIKHFSTRPPATKQNGNTHYVARLIFAAATGRMPPTEAALLKAVQREIARRKEATAR